MTTRTANRRTAAPNWQVTALNEINQVLTKLERKFRINDLCFNMTSKPSTEGRTIGVAITRLNGAEIASYSGENLKMVTTRVFNDAYAALTAQLGETPAKSRRAA